jgi:hypothetical protein
MTRKGSWGIPLVANDGTTEGLIGDGRRLLVAQAAAGPNLRKHTSFTFLDTKKMRVVDRVRIPGHHNFDTISPDGRYLYLVEYVSEADFSRYRVRVYDMRARRLRREFVNDKRESVENMQGWPVAREKSPDRRWARFHPCPRYAPGRGDLHRHAVAQAAEAAVRVPAETRRGGKSRRSWATRANARRHRS